MFAQLRPRPGADLLPDRTIVAAAVGLEAYRAGSTAGFGREVIDAAAEHDVILEGAITTPQGGYKSVNVSLRKTPHRLAEAQYADRALAASVPASQAPRRASVKTLHGVDVVPDGNAPGHDADTLGAALDAVAGPRFRLSLIADRGMKVCPHGQRQTTRPNLWRCRFVAADDQPLGSASMRALLLRIAEAGLEVVNNSNRYAFDGVHGDAQAQGE